MIRSSQDFWTGVLYVFFGLAAIFVAREYGMGSAFRMGPGYFPTVLGGLLVLIGVIAAVRSFLHTGDGVGRFNLKGLAFVFASIILFAVIIRRAGLAIALPLMVLLSASASGQFGWKSTLVLAAGLTLFCVLVFIKGLGVPLPIWGSWFGG
jgi:putative tricarboxylic transport membrane protein